MSVSWLKTQGLCIVIGWLRLTTAAAATAGAATFAIDGTLTETNIDRKDKYE
jgi:hypothetical protein